ncbi:hypothetical protein [Providencia stuartii]|uniref:tail fiber/spike domain-containing protein n=1 Tax=Providencia stuartii TaxID=588 RepID=UPI003214E781
MTKYDTNNPIGSPSVKDVNDNSINFDHAINNRSSETWQDRLGVKRKTWHGIEKDNERSIAEFRQESNKAILAAGYAPVGTFQEGAESANRNETVLWKLPDGDGDHYRWDGDLPKPVPAGSTPQSTGGIGKGAWVSVGDASLRSDLLKSDGATLIGFGSKTVAESLPLFTSLFGIGDAGNSMQQNAIKLKELIDYAISNNRRRIYVDKDASIDDQSVPIPKKTEVFFFNAGGVLAGLYRRAVVHEDAPTNTRVENGIQHNAMRRFYNAASPTVVIMGDSISTEGPNALAKSDSMWSLIKKKVSLQNKAKNITYHNRAIGGQTWLHANSKPTSFPSWYTNQSTDWLEYVKELQPDLLFLAFGMNDSNGFNAGAFFSVINKINQWTKIPSICIITNPVPAMNVTWENGFYATVFQEGRDYAANYVRSYAQWAGYSILDINRQFNLIRDGRDPLNAPLQFMGKREKSYLNGDVTMFDFSYKFTVNNWPIDKVLSIKCGLGALDNIYIKNLTGLYQVSAFASSSLLSTYFQKTTDTNVVVGDVVEVTVRANKCAFYVNNNLVLEFNVIRHGGLFASVVGYQDDLSSSPFTSIEVCRGTWLQCRYTATDSDIWGHDDGTSGTKYPEGGNGINHYSSQGLRLICAPVIDAADFSSEIETQRYDINRVSDGVEALTAIRCFLANGVVSLDGRLKVTITGTIKLFDFPSEISPSLTKFLSTLSQKNTGAWANALLEARSDGLYWKVDEVSNSLILDGLTFRI